MQRPSARLRGLRVRDLSRHAGAGDVPRGSDALPGRHGGPRIGRMCSRPTEPRVLCHPHPATSQTQ
eukprot:scaffold189371_cov20-Prasinocladus_malaysianus.AAC.1